MDSLHRTESAEPSIVSALGRVLEAGQRTVVDRIDLARLDLLAVLTRAGQGAVLVIAGVIPVSIGWLALTAAAVIVLDGYLARAASVALVGGINVLAGLFLIGRGVQRTREDAVTSPNDTGRVGTAIN